MTTDARPMKSARGRALLALALLVPAPSLGTLAGMVLLPNTALGTTLFATAKIWLLALPLVWYLRVDHGRFSLSPPRRGGFVVGAISGIVLSGAILIAFIVCGSALVDREVLVRKVTEVGLGSPGKYWAGAAYWIMVNSVLEEYVWRWFCVKQCARLMPAWAAVACSALFFTLHHIVALATMLPVGSVALCSTGIFVGGAVWSWLYTRYGSVWPSYVSHAIVDVSVFGVGAWMVFG